MDRVASCHCGALHIRCLGEPIKVSLCHCVDCQRRTGSLFSVAAFWPRDSVTMDRSNLHEYRRDSASGFPVSFFHCPHCGSNLWWEPARMPQWIGVAVGAFADPAFPMPEQAVWSTEKHAWLRLPDSIPSHPRNPPPRNGQTVVKVESDIVVLTYQDRHFADVRDLWLMTFPDDPPWNRAEHSIAEKVRTQPDLFLVAERGGRAIGTAMAGYDGHRGWLYSIAVEQGAQRLGIGTALLAEVEARLAALGCGKINLQVRDGNEAVVSFYERNGYHVERRMSMGKRLSF